MPDYMTMPPGFDTDEIPGETEEDPPTETRTFRPYAVEVEPIDPNSGAGREVIPAHLYDPRKHVIIEHNPTEEEITVDTAANRAYWNTIKTDGTPEEAITAALAFDPEPLE